MPVCRVCKKFKKKSVHKKHQKICLGGRPTDYISMGGTSKEADYKKKQKKGGKNE